MGIFFSKKYLCLLQFSCIKFFEFSEPKFEIPSGDPYTGGWCRPQTDGPALRAMALSKWGMILIDNGHSDQAKSDVWPLVNFDMEWAVANWDQMGTQLHLFWITHPIR